MSQPRFFNFGLVGFPLGHSVSPQIHAAALKAAGLQGRYHTFPIPPLPEGRLPLIALLDRVRRSELHGLNVTIPHKQSVIDLLDELDPDAAAVGAVNTIGLSNGALTGWNTDISGFTADLEAARPEAPGRALVLGAGGAARAVVYALQQAGWHCAVAARDPSQAAQLAADLGIDIERFDLPPHPGELTELFPVLLVNATPVGMAPAINRSPWPPDLDLPPECMLYDLVYNPRETRLLVWARSKGHRTADGLGMLVRQAAESFQIWTQHWPDPDVLHTAAARALSAADQKLH